MIISRIQIESFRRIKKADISFEPASFLIGPNNTGKSSVIAAIDALLSLETEKLSQTDIYESDTGDRDEKTVITGYITGITPEVAGSRGFKGRVTNNEFVYRKTLTTASNKPVLETREYPYSLKAEYKGSKTFADLISKGISEDVLKEAYNILDINNEDKLKKDWERSLPEVLDFDTNAEPTWVKNPGGIPQNVLSKLPRLIHVPAITDIKEIESGEKRYILGECLSLLFEDLIQDNPVAKTIQDNLDVLEKQMNPKEEESLIFNLLTEVNKIICDVFPNCGIVINPSLQNLLDVLKPKYEINIFSNIKTGVARQGTGLLRTCVFAMLRHHAHLKLLKELHTRTVVFAFEEPEQYLHPSAANMLRDTIYSLGKSDQIICSTHSPWMIDLSQDPQSLSRLYITDDRSASAFNYSISSVLGSLPVDDIHRVKMLQVFDDELYRVFFADKVVIVEGDSELLSIRGTLKLLPPDIQKYIQSQYQIVKARGKASIISLIKYLKDLKIFPRVMHDGDYGTEGAEKFNKPIADILDNNDHLAVLNKNLEETLGYTLPSYDKPFKAFEYVNNWNSHTDVPEQWRVSICKLFDIKWPE